MAYSFGAEDYNIGKAKELLRHYFRVVADRAGVRWDSDNDAEVGDVIDYIMRAVDAKIKEANNG